MGTIVVTSAKQDYHVSPPQRNSRTSQYQRGSGRVIFLFERQSHVYTTWWSSPRKRKNGQVPLKYQTGISSPFPTCYASKSKSAQDEHDGRVVERRYGDAETPDTQDIGRERVFINLSKSLISTIRLESHLGVPTKSR